MVEGNPFVVSGPMLQQVTQGLLEMKKMARSIENSAEAFLPLTDDPDITESLSKIGHSSSAIAQEVSKMYRLVAREAALS